MLLPDNLGENLSIDEASLQDDLSTFLSNKDGHCRQGTIIAAVRGTKADDVIKVLMQLLEEGRLKVKEVTMDLSTSMQDIITAVFPNATIVLDCFHVIKRCNDAIEELRLKFKREAQVDNRREERKFRERKKRNEYHCKWYRKTHPKTYEGKVRSRKPARKNEKYRPQVLSNGDTVIELLTRAKHSLTQSPEKWSEKQKERMTLLFERYPKLEEWYKAVNACPSREVKAAREAIKSREDNVLNYFINRSTNTAAESLNSKLKSLRAQFRGVSDLPFFMFRLSKIFG